MKDSYDNMMECAIGSAIFAAIVIFVGGVIVSFFKKKK